MVLVLVNPVGDFYRGLLAVGCVVMSGLSWWSASKRRLRRSMRDAHAKALHHTSHKHPDNAAGAHAGRSGADDLDRRSRVRFAGCRHRSEVRPRLRDRDIRRRLSGDVLGELVDLHGEVVDLLGEGRV
jgi:hypothetical protein